MKQPIAPRAGRRRASQPLASRKPEAMRRFFPGPPRHWMRGQSLAECTVLLGLVGLVLVLGQDSPLEMLFRAVQAAYGRFTFALSMP